MFPPMTPAVSLALESAGAWAARLGAGSVEPVHLILALLEEEDGRAATLLSHAGLARDTVLSHLVGQAQPIQSEPATAVTASAALQALFARARSLARELSGEPTFGSESVLLAALCSDSALRASLEGIGLDFGHLEAEIRSLHGRPVEIGEPLELAMPIEATQSARVLDAAANRAREALRTVEDYCRFVRNDAFLSEEHKQLRHDLTDILRELLSAPESLGARDTPGDVGVEIATAQEGQRFSLADVALANCKRLQEALRSLEEHAKLRDLGLAQGLEKLRYRAYSLEKAIGLETVAKRKLEGASLYVLVSGASCDAALDWTIKEAAAGGAGMFQLREKNKDDRQLLDRARRVRRWTREAGALFIVNDRPDIARLAEADGVHLGQQDVSVADARRILGGDALIGVSTHELDQLKRAILEGASYVGVGPVFSSGTKTFAGLAGLDYVRQATATTSLPAFAIGGIDESNVAAVMAAGALRIAVAQCVCRADDPRAVSSRLSRQLEEAATKEKMLRR